MQIGGGDVASFGGCRLFHGAQQKSVHGAGTALGRLEQEGFCGRLEGAGVDAHFMKPVMEVFFESLGRPTVQMDAIAQPGHQGPVDSPETAVRAAIVAQYKRKETSEQA